MRFIDYFDVHNPKHLQAFCSTNFSQEFVDELHEHDVTVNVGW